MADDYKSFKGLTFEDFKARARDAKLTDYEKIGFPDSYREGFEPAIFDDIVGKLPALSRKGSLIIDIGPGCATLPRRLIELCEKKGHTLVLIDSSEMLSELPDKPFIRKRACRFPDCPELIEEYRGKADAVLAYSVLQHVFLEMNLFSFIDKAVALLKEGGDLLLGDIPNVTKRKRFFSSREGIETHRKFTGKDELPEVSFTAIDEDKVDDGVVFAILQRYRNAGFETYLLPQGAGLPLKTRREDILIRRHN